MSKFVLTKVEEVQHKRCQFKCGVREGVMLKCMNLEAVDNQSCGNIIHASCGGYNLCVLPYMTDFYCTSCTKRSSALHQKMKEITNSAEIAAAKEKSSQAGSLRPGSFSEIISCEAKVMPSFLLTDVEEFHHKRCQDSCDEREGIMLKCMNLEAGRSKPCGNIIHAICAGYDLCILPHVSEYYCKVCKKESPELHQRMSEVEKKARLAAKTASSASSSTISMEEHEEIKRVAVKLAAQLEEKVEWIKQQAAELEAQKMVSQRQDEELKQLQETVGKLMSEKSSSGSQSCHSAFIDRIHETLRLAEGFKDAPSVQSCLNPTNIQACNRSNINSTSNLANSNQGWPNYDEQQKIADQYDDYRLMLLRVSLAKPVPFDGDVTKWATFLSEFIRTSVRGSFREYEDMDRLRELVIGEARDMFTTELSDPCAEALVTLKRLDEFFGVRGNSVRVAMDRIVQLPRVNKSTDKQKITELYTNAKQFALQCRIHNQQHELASQAILFIMESKMFNDHVLEWRQWTKVNHKLEDVDGLISYLEELIRDLSYKSITAKLVVSANVNATDVTGGLDDGGTSSSSYNSDYNSSDSSCYFD